jgi:hypothetical protein
MPLPAPVASPSDDAHGREQNLKNMVSKRFSHYLMAEVKDVLA